MPGSITLSFHHQMCCGLTCLNIHRAFPRKKHRWLWLEASILATSPPHSPYPSHAGDCPENIWLGLSRGRLSGAERAPCMAQTRWCRSPFPLSSRRGVARRAVKAKDKQMFLQLRPWLPTSGERLVTDHSLPRWRCQLPPAVTAFLHAPE